MPTLTKRLGMRSGDPRTKRCEGTCRPAANAGVDQQPRRLMGVNSPLVHLVHHHTPGLHT
jgi:hypothetical protein